MRVGRKEVAVAEDGVGVVSSRAVLDARDHETRD